MERIISGGQTGADRAALDFAIRHGIPHGGWCPRGRRSEDGVIPECYVLDEAPTNNYRDRTVRNIRDSDGTALFTMRDELTPGSMATFTEAIKMGKPFIRIQAGDGFDMPALKLRKWIKDHDVKVLNVAGHRLSMAPLIGHFVHAVLSLGVL